MTFLNKLEHIFEEKSSSSFKQITEEQAVNVLKKKAKDFLPQKIVTVFLDDSEAQGVDYTLVDPKNTKPNYSYHSLIIDTFSNWDEDGNGYPKYEKGILATLNPYAESSKRKYFAIVFDNTKIGITSGESLIESFPNVSAKLNVPFEKFDKNFNILLNIFNNYTETVEENTQLIKLKNLETYTKSKEEFKHALSVVDEFFEQKPERISYLIEHPQNKNNYPYVISMLQYFRSQKDKQSKKMVNIVSNLFNPSENGFEMTYFKNFDWISNKNNKKKKIWFDEPCLLIRENLLDSFLKLISDNEKD